MVSVGVSSLGYTDLVFPYPDIKINGSYYRDMLLKHPLPAIHSISCDFFTFQQDSAPAHRGASETVTLLSAELLTSSVHWSGHGTARISVWWTKQFGGFCGSDSTVTRSATSITWKNDWLKSGVALIRTLLTEHESVARKGDILNIWFKKLNPRVNCVWKLLAFSSVI